MSRRLATWWGLAAAVAIGGAAVALVRLAGPPIYCGNGYFNIRFAEILRHEGILRSFPWFQEAIHRDTYANFNLLYHFFLVPFTFGDLLTGARLAGIVGGALAVGAFWGALRLLRAPAPLLWTVLLLGAAPELLYRLTFTRALVLGLALSWLATASILTGRAKTAAILGFLFPYVHVSFHLLPAMALAHDVLRTPAAEDRGWRRFRVSAWTCTGVVLGLVLNPFFPHNLRFWAIANFGVLGAEWAHLDDALYASEMAPMRSDHFLLANLGAFAATALAVLLLTWLRKASDQARTLLVVTFGFFALSLQSHRFAEQWAPFAVLLLAIVVRDGREQGLWTNPRRIRLAAGAALVLGLVLLVFSVQVDRAAAASEEVVDYAAASAWMAENVPPGDTLFHPGYDEFDVLFFHDPRRRFLFGIDPGFFLAANRDRYALWSRVVHGAMADAWQPIRRTFGCRWVFLPSRYVSLRALLDRDPRFVPRYRDRDCGIYELEDDRGHAGDWTVRGWFPDPGRKFMDAPPPATGKRVVLRDVSGFVDLRRALSIPPAVHDVCAVAETSITAAPGSALQLEVATDDEVRLMWDGGPIVERSPYRNPPPGTPGGPPLDLSSLSGAPRGPDSVVVRGVATAPRTRLQVAACQVGADFGFVVRRR
jgi:hypothetical protein